MTFPMPSRPACSGALLLCTMIAAGAPHAGCTATPQEHLHGRWFNDATSIRFRSDGSVIYNSTSTGLTTGRYYFDGELRPESAATPVNNLTLDLMTNGRTERWSLEVQFLGGERMRLQPVTTVHRGRPSDGVAAVMILSKAADDETASVAAAR
jgi:hypothetical protein